MSVQKSVHEIIKGTRIKKPVMWEDHLETQQPSAKINKIMTQTSKPELAHYLHAALFRPNISSLTKAIKQGFLKT